jgi:hypothetical protein
MVNNPSNLDKLFLLSEGVDEEAKWVCLEAICNLLFSEETRIHVLTANALPVLEQILLNSPSSMNHESAYQCSLALAKISCDEASKSFLTNDSFLRLILHFLSSPSFASSPTREFAAITICNMCWLVEEKDFLVRRGLGPTLIGLLKDASDASFFSFLTTSLHLIIPPSSNPFYNRMHSKEEDEHKTSEQQQQEEEDGEGGKSEEHNGKGKDHNKDGASLEEQALGFPVSLLLSSFHKLTELFEQERREEEELEEREDQEETGEAEEKEEDIAALSTVLSFMRVVQSFCQVNDQALSFFEGNEQQTLRVLLWSLDRFRKNKELAKVTTNILSLYFVHASGDQMTHLASENLVILLRKLVPF